MSPFSITIFKDVHATTLDSFHTEEHTLESLADLIRSTSAPTKKQLRLLKLSTYGQFKKPNPEKPESQWSYRHDDNVEVVYGIECDYDGEKVPFVTAVEQMRAAGVKSLVTTSPSSTPGKPRWRVLIPLSEEKLSNERLRYANMANAILGGVLAQESFRIHQAFYFGNADDNPNLLEVELVEGEFIDKIEGLAELPFRPAKTDHAKKGPINYAEWLLDWEPKFGTAKHGLRGCALRAMMSAASTRYDRDTVIADLTPIIRSAPRLKEKETDAFVEHEIIAKLASMYDDAAAKIASDWERTPGGALVHDSQANVTRAIGEIGVRLSYDEFNRDDLVDGRELNDHEANELWLAMVNRFGLQPSERFWEKMLGHLTHANSFHPVCAHIDSFVWDGVSRLGDEREESRHYEKSWLTTYLGAEDTQLNRAIGRLFLTAAVRRIKRPGCKFDQMLVLQDPQQGTGKSTVVQILAGHIEWFTDSLKLKDVGDDKKVIEQLDGKWFVEISEADTGTPKINTDEVKTFLSQTHNTAREAYGRRPITAPRQSVCIGTTNREEFLDDEQNRRYWPVKTKEIDLAGLRRDRDQLIAEAAVMEAEDKSDEALVLAENLWAAAAEVQEAHRREDPWEGVLRRIFGNMSGQVLPDAVWIALGKSDSQRNQFDGIRMGRVMRAVGFRRTKIKQVWHYVRGNTPMPIYVHRNKFPPFNALASYEETPPADFERTAS